MIRWIILAVVLGALVAAAGLSAAVEFPWRGSIAAWLGAPDRKAEAKMPLEDWPICTTMGTMGSRPTGHNSTRISRRARRSWSPRIGMGRSRRDRQMKDGFTYRGTEFDASGGSFMIDVHPRNRLTHAICRTPPPHGVIEGEHAVRAGRIPQHALLGIVRPTDLVLVVEVAAY